MSEHRDLKQHLLRWPAACMWQLLSTTTCVLFLAASLAATQFDDHGQDYPYWGWPFTFADANFYWGTQGFWRDPWTGGYVYNDGPAAMFEFDPLPLAADAVVLAWMLTCFALVVFASSCWRAASLRQRGEIVVAWVAVLGITISCLLTDVAFWRPFIRNTIDLELNSGRELPFVVLLLPVIAFASAAYVTARGLLGLLITLTRRIAVVVDWVLNRRWSRSEIAHDVPG